MAVQGHSFGATATKYCHPDISHLAVSVAAVFLYIAIVTAAIRTHPGRGALAQLCFPQDDFNLLPMCLCYQGFDLAQGHSASTDNSKTQRFLTSTFY